MSKLPLVDAKTFEKIILLLGCEIKCQRGSHVFYRHPDGRYTKLPYHKGNNIGRSLTCAILRQTEISPEQYID